MTQMIVSINCTYFRARHEETTSGHRRKASTSSTICLLSSLTKLTRKRAETAFRIENERALNLAAIGLLI